MLSSSEYITNTKSKKGSKDNNELYFTALMEVELQKLSVTLY